MEVIATVSHPQVGNLSVVRNPTTRKYFILNEDTGKRTAIKASEVPLIKQGWGQ
jgi:hypothetical protein